MAKAKTIFVCNNCGYETAKWLGKCPACNSWNTFYEQKIEKYTEENKIEEIRLRSNKRLCLKIGPETVLAEYIVSQQELLQTFEKICENSIYSYRRQICEGFITIRGGNRVGIVGSGVIENGQVININYISSLNIRIARQQIGCSQKVMSNIINSETNTIYNTLIISPPRMWKNNIIKSSRDA